MALATAVGVGGSGVEIEVGSGVNATEIGTVGVKLVLAVDTGVWVAALWRSWGVGEDVPEQAANITAHSRASPAGQVMLA